MDEFRHAPIEEKLISRRGQGMLEYILVVAVVVAVSVTALSTVTTSCGVLVSTVVDEIEAQTGVEEPGD